MMPSRDLKVVSFSDLRTELCVDKLTNGRAVYHISVDKLTNRRAVYHTSVDKLTNGRAVYHTSGTISTPRDY